MEALQRCFVTVQAISNEFKSALLRDRVAMAKCKVNRDKDAEKFVSQGMRVRAGQSFGKVFQKKSSLCGGYQSPIRVRLFK